MDRHEFLRNLHAVVRPRNYLEIGVQTGKSLRLSRAPSIGVDPAFRIEVPIAGDLRLIRSTSDKFFASADPIAYLRSGRNPVHNFRRHRPLFDHYLGGTRLDLVFIDGMHLFEYALRDLMNVERFADWYTVIVFDDMLPRNGDEAARERSTRDWTGDVFKLTGVLQTHRPDLVTVLVDTEPTGTLIVLGADPRSRLLAARYEAIVASEIAPDPQEVPDWVLQRMTAVEPDALLTAPLWAHLVRARSLRRGRASGVTAIRRDVKRLQGRTATITTADDPHPLDEAASPDPFG